VADDNSSGRPNQTVVDYVTIALSPALIMGLVGSLVFFLLEVFYKTDGEWKSRLQWILGFFVFGAVLTARISMNGDVSSRAPLYGLVLGVATLIGLHLFVEYPEAVKDVSFLINVFLVAVVSWCSYRLTWDCTNVDEETDMSGEGLLQAAGLESGPAAEKEPADEEPEEPKKPLSWLERYRRYRENREKKRTLGVWVVYFSLAALPLFGLGQSLIPLTAPERRQFAFWLMTVYVGCGLGLLLTTCFLGLRRYLRQKRLQMPAAMTGAWLTVGAVLILLLLVAGALLPRPYSEYPIVDFHSADSAKRKANRLAFKGDSPAEEKGDAGAPREGKNPDEKSGEQGKGQGEGDKDAKDGQAKDGQGKDGQDKSGSSGDKSEQGKGKQGGQDKDKSGQGDKSEKGEKSGKSGSGRKADPGKAHKALKNMENRGENRSSSRSSRLANVQQFFQRVGPILKWIVFAVIAVLVVLAVARSGLGFLSNFADWAKRLLAAWNNFWASLFGGSGKESAGEEGTLVSAAAKPRVVPFSSFSNPFASGKAAKTPAREVVRYTFLALEAWARQHDLARRDDETALEFVARLGDEVPSLEGEANKLAQLHARAEYARDKLPANTLEVLRAFWEQLERVAIAPMSA
jgi:hypothetical protein